MSNRKSTYVDLGRFSQEDGSRIRMLRAKIARARAGFHLGQEINAVRDLKALCASLGEPELGEWLCKP